MSIGQRFGDDVVLVTGGSGGLGSACARWFAANGAKVALADLPSASLADVAAEVRARQTVEIDVRDESSVEEAVATIYAHEGPISILVNAAGIVGAGSVESMASSAWRAVLDVNLTGTFLVSRAVLPHFRELGRGKIVSISSVNAHTGGNELSGAAYAASKAGVEALTRHLARALAPNVQVNAVAPGPVATSMLERLTDDELAGLVGGIPAARVADPSEVAAAVGFLASSEAGYVTGTTLHQNGGAWVG